MFGVSLSKARNFARVAVVRIVRMIGDMAANANTDARRRSLNNELVGWDSGMGRGLSEAIASTGPS